MIITKSVYANGVLLSLYLNKPYTPLPSSTINELFDITNTTNVDNEVPTLNLLTIGKRPIVVDDNINLHDYYISPTNAVLKEHMPVAARPISKGLSNNDRLRYRLRVEKRIDNVDYEFYYGILVADHNSSNDGTVVIQPTEDGMVPTNFNPADFNAIKPDTIIEPTSDNGRYVVSSNAFNVGLTADILEDIYIANKLLYPGEDVYIGELGLCTSIDSTRSVNTGIGLITYNESVYAQVSYTVKVTIPLVKNNPHDLLLPYSNDVDIGGMENIIIPSNIREVSEWRPV